MPTIIYCQYLVEEQSSMPSYLGQNFLKDSTYTNFIVQKIEQYCQECNLDSLVEIGPGKGALTKKLLPLGMSIILCEKDQKMLEYLDQNILPPYDPERAQKIVMIAGDVLEHNPAELLTDFGFDPSKTLIAGNLPYYITSPILTQFFGGEDPKFNIGIFMVQKEVADKVRYDAEKKSFLRWLLNYHFEVHYLKTVPAKAFKPAPKVQSAIISLIRKKNHPGCPLGQVRVLLERISMYKRKTLGKSWKMAQKDRLTRPADSMSNELMLGEYRYELPDDLAGKRIEEISREEMERIYR